MDDADEVTTLVPGAHRVIRRLESSAAFAGELVSDGDRQRVRADADGVDETLWRFSGAEHVAGVRDVERTRDGQAVLLPWCADAVDAVLARRLAAGRALVAGEVVTLVGSLLRGVIEVAGHDLRGRWWLDDEARPLFVPGEGTTCADAAVEIIERLRRDCSDRALERLLRRVADAAADHRVVLRTLDAWEHELSELAAPRPIDVAVYAPERVRELPVHRARLPQDAERMQQGSSLRDRVDDTRARMVARLNAVRTRVGRLRPRPGGQDRMPGGRRRSAGDSRTPRRRMLLVGVAVAGVVLTGGLMWPPDGDDAPGTDAVAVEGVPDAPADVGPMPAGASAPADAAQPPDGRGEEAAHESAEDAADAPSVDGSIEEAVTGLLVSIDSCRADDDAECDGAVVRGAVDGIRDRLGPGSATREVSLIEDYGDIAVLRLGRTEERREQMIVIVRENDEWLVRDVYDVADQPSEED
ncbi:hypothetical protein ACU045_12015 [Microbacterium sp. MAHUQ-60]|uniref:hypothetical protein n=1 Tax=unclassified Microbacterium TaxID=2609290 RepID=UPI003623568A